MPKLKLRSLQDAMTCIGQDTKTHIFTEGDNNLFSHISNPTFSTSTAKHSDSPPDIGDHNSVETETLIPRASTVSSHRFFFSPHTTKSIMEEAGHGRRKAKSMGVFRELERATTMAMSSYDPYRDFRRSMEEMVEAHGIQEWPQMQELLHCYLRLNDRRTHSTILLAFADLLMCRINR